MFLSPLHLFSPPLHRSLHHSSNSTVAALRKGKKGGRLQTTTSPFSPSCLPPFTPDGSTRPFFAFCVPPRLPPPLPNSDPKTEFLSFCLPLLSPYCPIQSLTFNGPDREKEGERGKEIKGEGRHSIFSAPPSSCQLAHGCPFLFLFPFPSALHSRCCMRRRRRSPATTQPSENGPGDNFFSLSSSSSSNLDEKSKSKRGAEPSR